MHSFVTACMTDIANPAEAITVTVPKTFEYDSEVYTTTELWWGTFSSKRANVTGLILPDTLVDADASFSKFPNLTELTIPGSVKNFGGSFQNMGNLQTLTFSEGVEEISGNSMVRNCDSLTEVNLPSTLKRMTAPAVFSGTSAFAGCGKLTSIPDLSQVTNVGGYAFDECRALPGPVNLGNVTEMGGYAFNNCRKLTGALDLSKLDVIPSHAFTYVAGITSIQFSETLTSIGDWAFVWANVDTLDFPETLKTVGTYAFYSASKLSGTVRIPDSVTSIGKGAFQKTAVEKFEIGSGVESINANVFEGNAALKEIVFDNSQDNVTITGTLPANVTVTYTQQSIPDDVGDKISNAADAPTLQEAVNAAAAAENGGMWFCATGKADVHVTEGAAIFGNTAQDTDLQKGAGDDFVFSARPADDYPATLANRMLGGGAVQWYKDGAVYLPSTGVYPTTSDTTPRYGTDGADPNPVTVEGYKNCLALKAIPLSDDVKHAAEKEAALLITGNTADKGGGIGANGGIDIGTDATTSVNVTKVWSGDSEADRPASITVNLLGNGVVIDTVTLTEANNWSHIFEALPTTDKNGQSYTYTVSETAVPGYTTQITGDAQIGFTITNTKEDSYTSLTVDKVWMLDDGGKAAASVQVELLRDGQRYEIVELNEKNGWNYTWDQLNDKYDWSVAEVDVPEGFTSTVSHQGNQWTITNDDIPGTTDPTDPSKPTDPDMENPGEETDTPQTGDNSNLLMWIMLTLLGGGAVLTLTLKGKKKINQ